MEELRNFFGKYFPKHYGKFPVKRIELEIKNREVFVPLSKNSINIIKLRVYGVSKLNLNLSNVLDAVIYIDLLVSERSKLTFNVYGKVESDVYLGIRSISREYSRLDLLERILIKGRLVNITKLSIPKGSKEAFAILNQMILMDKNASLINLPLLEVREPRSKAEHMSKKIKLDAEQIFYLQSKGLTEKQIYAVLEKTFLVL